VERSKERVANFYADLDARLQEVPFVAGEIFSVADITALVTVDFATNGIATPILAESRALKAWYDMIASRPSAQA
jgi:glutathione S-transferase